MKDPNWHKCLLRADSRDVIKRIPDNSIDFILTDPPYNLGRHSTGNIPLPKRSAINNDVAEWDMVDFNPEEWADDFIRILKPTGNLFIFTSYNQLGRWYDVLDHRFDTSNFMIWHKTNPVPKIFKAGFLNSCEMIFTCWNKKHTWNFISQTEMHNFIESPICMRPERLSSPKHPTQKPVSILKKMIRIATNKNDIVFDPFMGVGSTGVAALELERRFIGVELDYEYFDAAKKRIETVLQSKEDIQMGKTKPDKYEEGKRFEVRDGGIAYQTSFFEMDHFFNSKNEAKVEDINVSTGLQPIVKWPGGKEKELKYIIPNLPKFNRFFEPFVGGGAVFMGIKAKEYYINDYSHELISLYNSIANADELFFQYVEQIDNSWKNAEVFFHDNFFLVDTYLRYRHEELTKEELKSAIHQFCFEKQSDILHIIGTEFSAYPCILLTEMETTLSRKMTRMHELEKEKHILPEKDLYDNIETAIKGAVYMNYRHLYNNAELALSNGALHCALFFFIRNYAYSGMFRYSSRGDFNVPYGGIAYNSKFMVKKLNYYRSKPLRSHFVNARIYNLDFEKFLRKTQPSIEDFIFLDPPYDSEFSTYAQNEFSREDQKRLANYLIEDCRAKWMLIIKNTDFIYGLYDRPGINIRTFDKEYLVSFMNRNEKKVTHLLITNY